jgi:hypothetical protein
MVYSGTVQNGMIVVNPSVCLPEGASVLVEVVNEASNHDAGPANDALLRMSELAVDTGIPDLSANLDHYLYGHAKAADGQ